MNINLLLYFFILFGAFFAVIIALGQVLLKNRQRHNVILALLLLSIAMWLGATGLYPFVFSNELKLWKTIVALAIAIPLYCSGPLVYFYFQFLIDEDYKIKKIHLIYLLPVFTAIIMIILDKGPGVWYLLHISVIYCALFLIAIIKEIYNIIRNAGKKRQSIILIVLLICVYLIGLAVLRVVTDRGTIPSIGITIFLIVIYLLSHRNSEFLMIIKIEAEKNKYAQSQLNNIDVDMIVKKLHTLLSVEKMYIEESLSLQSLASAIGITKHQLSELLNVQFNMTFNNYINQFRINEAKSLIIAEPESSIISIAYAVGFNSTSAFYTAFQKNTGMSPTAFRQSNA